MLGTAFVATLLVIAALLIPQGEVVTLHTSDANGDLQQTQLWIVDIEGQRYLRAVDPDSEWLSRLRADPNVELGVAHERADSIGRFRAEVVADEAVRGAVNAAMKAKYGMTESLVEWISDPTAGVAVRLVPRSVPDVATSTAH